MSHQEEAMDMGSPHREPFEDEVDSKDEKKPDVKPDVDEKPDVQIVEEVAADSSGVAAHVIAKAKETETLRQAEEILLNDPRRRASFAGLMCTLLEGDSLTLKEALKVSHV
jgi:hypothetical protein